MKKIFTILILSTVFAGELEVEGDLTVTGDIVSPTIDALRDDGLYEYKMYITKIDINNQSSTNISFHRYEDMNENDWDGNFHIELISLSSNGWSIHNSIPLGSNGVMFKTIIVFKRPIEE